MIPGRACDALIAEKVFGKKTQSGIGQRNGMLVFEHKPNEEVPNYSTSQTGASRLTDHLNAFWEGKDPENPPFHFRHRPSNGVDGPPWTAEILDRRGAVVHRAEHESVPWVTCLVVLSYFGIGD